MNLTQAFEHFINSEDYKKVAKENTSLGGKYRIYLTRFKKGELKAGAIVELLLANGYEVKANKVRKKNG